jgi:hypothetical protein
MTSRASNPHSTIRLAAAVALAGMLVFGSGVRARARSEESGSDDGLQGTWRVQVTLVNCMTSAPLGPPPFTSLLSFALGGTATASTSNPAFQPGQRTAEHGIWKQTGQDTYASVREAFILFTTEPNPSVPGFPRGTQRITEAIQVEDDQSTSVASVQFFDAGGTLVRTGCARAVGHRFK